MSTAFRPREAVVPSLMIPPSVPPGLMTPNGLTPWCVVPGCVLTATGPRDALRWPALIVIGVIATAVLTATGHAQEATQPGAQLGTQPQIDREAYAHYYGQLLDASVSEASRLAGMLKAAAQMAEANGKQIAALRAQVADLTKQIEEAKKAAKTEAKTDAGSGSKTDSKSQ